MFLCCLIKYLSKVLIDSNFAYVPTNNKMAMITCQKEAQILVNNKLEGRCLKLLPPNSLTYGEVDFAVLCNFSSFWRSSFFRTTL